MYFVHERRDMPIIVAELSLVASCKPPYKGMDFDEAFARLVPCVQSKSLHATALACAFTQTIADRIQLMAALDLMFPKEEFCRKLMDCELRYSQIKVAQWRKWQKAVRQFQKSL